MHNFIFENHTLWFVILNNNNLSLWELCRLYEVRGLCLNGLSWAIIIFIGHGDLNHYAQLALWGLMDTTVRNPLRLLPIRFADTARPPLCQRLREQLLARHHVQLPAAAQHHAAARRGHPQQCFGKTQIVRLQNVLQDRKLLFGHFLPTQHVAQDNW